MYYPTNLKPKWGFWRRPANVETWRAYWGMLVFQANAQRWNVAARALAWAFCFVVWTIFRVLATLEARKDAPLIESEEGLDVVAFSHGLAGFATCNAGLACELARRGIVVFAIDHADGSATVSKRANGSGVQWNLYVPNGGKFEARRAQTTTRLAEIASCADVIDALNRGETSTKNLLATRNNVNLHSMFRGRLKVDSKTLMGFSFGGGSAVVASANIDTFARVVVLDAWLEFMTDLECLERACRIPTLSVISEKWGTNARTENKHVLTRGKNRTFCEIEVPGSKHHCFSDVSFFFGAMKKVIGMVGSVDTRTFHAFNAEIIATFVRSSSAASLDDELRRVIAEYDSSLPGATLRR